MFKNTVIWLGMFFMLTSGYAQKELPPFSFLDLNGQPFGIEKLEANVPVIVVFFDPYCDHCAQQAKWIGEAKEQFKNIQLIWVSTEAPDAVKEFAKKHFAATEWKKVHFLIDKQYRFDGYFGYSEVPSIYIYNAARQRVKSFNKETPADILLRFL